MHRYAARTVSGLLALTLAGFMSFAQAAVILEIDISDPAAVTFTPTGAASEILVQETAFNGITLLDFFTGNTVTLDEPLDTGTIGVLNADGGGRDPLSYIFAGLFDGGWTLDDLNFYEPFVDFDQLFTTTAAAVVGGAAHDLSGLGLLPAMGTIGTVITGLPNAANPLVLGQWQVIDVNEPSTLGLLFIALAVFALQRRRRHD